MSERREYQMTDEQHARLMEACKPVVMIALQCGEPSSPYESAMRVWRALGTEMGFDWATVRPVIGKSDHYFTAKPVPAAMEAGDGK